jgi:hypothetical protein
VLARHHAAALLCCSWQLRYPYDLRCCGAVVGGLQGRAVQLMWQMGVVVVQG